MKKLIEALHVIQDECNRHYINGQYCCKGCPMSCTDGEVCCVSDLVPCHWKINDEVEKALL